MGGAGGRLDLGHLFLVKRRPTEIEPLAERNLRVARLADEAFSGELLRGLLLL